MRKILLFIVIMLPGFCLSQWVSINSPSFKEIAATGNNLFGVEENNGVYISTNNGNSWTQTSLNIAGIVKIAADGANVFAGTQKGNVRGIYRSTNSGLTWTRVLSPTELYGVTAITIDGNNIFASTGNYIYRSTNNGTNWVRTTHDFYVYSFAVTGINVFVGVEAVGVYLSTNRGLTWRQTSLNDKNTLSVIITGTNVFAGTEAGIYFSSNDGANWTLTSLGNNRYVSSLIAMNGNIFAGTDAGVFISKNHGTNWTQKNEGLPVEMRDGPRIAAMDGFVFSSNASFSTWRRSISDIISVQQIGEVIPKEYKLSQNYPNPFNPETKIIFSLPKKSYVTLKVYNISGKEVGTLVNENLNSGTYEYSFNGESLPSGIYLYKIEAGDYSESKSMILLK